MAHRATGPTATTGSAPDTDSRASDQWHAPGPRVEELLVLQQEFFMELESLGARQTVLVEEERTGELLALLGMRQRLVDGISEINTALEPFRTRWDEMMAALPEDMRLRLRRRVDALAGLAARIAQRDEADRLKLQERRDAVAEDLAQITRGRGALAAYGGERIGGPRFQDREA